VNTSRSLCRPAIASARRTRWLCTVATPQVVVLSQPGAIGGSEGRHVLPVMSTRSVSCWRYPRALRGAGNRTKPDFYMVRALNQGAGLPAARRLYRASSARPRERRACYCTTLMESPGLGSPLG